MGRVVIAALLMLVAGDDAIADDQRFGPPIQELQPSLTCAGKLITTTDKNTSDEAVRDFSVVVDFSKARGATIRLSQGKLVVDYSEARAPSVELSQGDAERLSANINSIDSLDILFSDSTSWGKDGSIKQFINGDINRVRGTMYAYETLWSEGGPVRIRHWYLQCKENWNGLVTCPPWGLGICLMPHSDPAPVTPPVKLTTAAILNALSGGLDSSLCLSLLPLSICHE